MSTAHRFKPAASARTHLLLAALLWSAVGIGLGTAGVIWSLAAGGSWPAVLIAGSVALGVLKGRMVLEKTARRAAARIEARGDGKCLGGFLSWKSWMLVVVMITLGRVLRAAGLPRPVLGVVYLTVGVALLWGGRVYWRAFGARSAIAA